MLHLRPHALTAGLVLAAFACATLFATGPTAVAAGRDQNASVSVPPKSHPDTGDWRPLFEDDLSNAIRPGGVWTYKDGVLTASEDQMLWTKKQYKDYILDLEFKMGAEANSGVVIDASRLDPWIPNSVEVQIADDSAEKWQKKPGTWHAGAIFGHKAPKTSAVKKPGKWNRMTITVKGPMVYVMLNGEPVNTMDRTKYTSAKKNPDGSNVPPWLSKPAADLPQKGHIGFQGKHGGAPIWFRNLRIKPLSDQ